MTIPFSKKGILINKKNNACGREGRETIIDEKKESMQGENN